MSKKTDIKLFQALGTLVRCKKCYERYLGYKEDELCLKCQKRLVKDR